MKYKAYMIRGWIINEISPMGWTMLIARALPELLEVNSSFSAYLINKYTEWGDQEIQIIQWYLQEMFQVRISSDFLMQNGGLEVDYKDLISVNFFSTNRLNLLNIKKLMFNIFKISRQ